MLLFILNEPALVTKTLCSLPACEGPRGKPDKWGLPSQPVVSNTSPLDPGSGLQFLCCSGSACLLQPAGPVPLAPG